MDALTGGKAKDYTEYRVFVGKIEVIERLLAEIVELERRQLSA